MTTHFLTSPTGERVSAVIPMAEYEALLRFVPDDETAYLLQEPNGSELLRRIESVRNGAPLVEHDLLPDED
mgnify:FL=1